MLRDEDFAGFALGGDECAVGGRLGGGKVWAAFFVDVHCCVFGVGIVGG